MTMSFAESQWPARALLFLLPIIAILDIRILVAFSLGFFLFRITSVSIQLEAHENAARSYSHNGFRSDTERLPDSTSEHGGRSISIPFFVNLVNIDGWSFDSIRRMFERRLHLQSRDELINLALDFFAYELRERQSPKAQAESHQSQPSHARNLYASPNEPPYYVSPSLPLLIPGSSSDYTTQQVGPDSLRHSLADVPTFTDPLCISPLPPSSSSEYYSFYNGPTNSYTVTRPGGSISDVRLPFGVQVLYQKLEDMHQVFR